MKRFDSGNKLISAVVIFIGLTAIILMPFTLAFMINSIKDWHLVLGGFSLLILEGFVSLLAFQIIAVLKK